MGDPTLPLTGLSSVSDKRLEAQFDDGMLSSDGGFGVADRLVACINDPRAPNRITHSRPKC